MLKTKQILMAGAALLMLGFSAQAVRADDTATTSDRTVGAGADSANSNSGTNAEVKDNTGVNVSTDDKSTSDRTIGAGADNVSTKSSEVKDTDGMKTATADKMAKPATHKKHMKKKPVKVLNATPGDTKTSNDDSGMKPDEAPHGKVSESTEER